LLTDNPSAASLIQFSPLQLASNADIDWLRLPQLSRAGVELGVLRLDSVHPVVSGNKIFKLYNHLAHYLDIGCNLPVASFGGIWSNHLHALSAMSSALGIKSVGVVRGEPVKNAALRDFQLAGMMLHFVTRSEYRLRYSSEWLCALEGRLGPLYWVPEGGGGTAGAEACTAIAQTILERVPDVNVIAVACGTGTTLAGIIAGAAAALKNSEKNDLIIEGYSALKGIDTVLKNDIAGLLKQLSVEASVNWRVEGRFHSGGFAKFPAYLDDFVNKFEQMTGLMLDPVYTAKLMYGLFEKIAEGHWPCGTKIVAVHSGGLQGRRGFSLPTV